MYHKSIATLAFFAAACAGGDSAPAPGDVEVFSGIREGETVRFTGTEPFWNGTVASGEATYTTPDNIEGVTFPVERFAGNSGVSFSGMMDNQRWDMMVTPGECSDGMSDRDYPYTVTLMIGEEHRRGCAWTDRQPFEERRTP